MRFLMAITLLALVTALAVLVLTYVAHEPDAVYPMVNQRIVWEK